MLTREQETELFVKARAGDSEAREFLIKNHLLFAARHARQLVRGKLPDNDVVSAANFAVMRAFDKFDHTLGHRFTVYLKFFIRGEIASLWRNLSTVRMKIPGKPDQNAPTRALNDVGEYHSSNSPKTYAGRVPIPTDDPHQEAEEDEHLSHLQALLNESKLSLNPHEQDIIRRVYEEQKNFAEIGRENGVTREAIRATHDRALAKLQKAMKAKGVENTR
jgi:RNA polymerase sigma factor (sigma-70 family)